MSSRLDISQLKFDQNDIGNLIKSTKTINSWEFVLDGNRQKIELQHSRLKGKRIVIYNGKEMSNSMVFTYNYCYSFPIDKHYLTIIQISPDQYDLRIDNISFLSMLNRQKIEGFSAGKKNEVNNNSSSNNNKEKKKIKDDDNFFASEGDSDFNFDDKVFSNKSNTMDFDFGGNDNKPNTNPPKVKVTQKPANLLDFGFDNNEQPQPQVQQPKPEQQPQQNLTFNFLKTSNATTTNQTTTQNTPQTNLLFDTFESAPQNNNNTAQSGMNSVNWNTSTNVNQQPGMFDFSMQSNSNQNNATKSNNPFDFQF